jgi:hypothetical protein
LKKRIRKKICTQNLKLHSSGANVIFMETLKAKIGKITADWETDYYDPKEVLISHLDNPELFEFLFPWPKPPRHEQTRQIIETLLS